MKKYLLIFLCIFVVFSSANGQQDSLPAEMDITVTAWERQTGKTAVDFIELLKQPQHSDHPRASSWIDELLDRNNPAIDHQLVQLLAQKHWLESPPNQDDVSRHHVSRWMDRLIRQEFADDQDVITMFEQDPWKSHFASYIVTETQINIVMQTTMNMVTSIHNNTERNLRVAVGQTFAKFLISGLNSQLDLANNPRLFTWTVTILTTMKAQGFEREFADAFEAVKSEVKANWKDFDDLDRLTEFLLTESTAPLESRLLFVIKLPRTRHPQLLDWILTEARNLQLNVSVLNAFSAYHSSAVDLLNLLLKDHLSEWTLSQPTNTTPYFSEKDIETALRTVDLLLNILTYQPYNDPSTFPVYDNHLADVLTILATEVGFDNPRISERVGQILERNHLLFSKIVQLLQLPGWRDHPNAPTLLVRVTGYGLSLLNTRRLEELLADPFWQNHPELKNQLGRRFFVGPYRSVTINNIRHSFGRRFSEMSPYRSATLKDILRSCRSALTKGE